MPESKKLRTRKILFFLVCFGGLFALAIPSFIQSDRYVLATADPAMSELADAAYMSNAGKILFLKTDPERVNEARIAAECATSLTEGSSLEFGCYDPNTNKILLRDLPAQFDNYEPVIAAHEMLHAAFSINDISPELQKELLVESSKIQETLAVYGELDENNKINETHSFTATEKKVINQTLETYFAQYFTNRTSVAQLHENHTIQLNNLLTEVNNLKANTDSWKVAADKYYQSHTLAAQWGDAYNANYYYKQYIDHFNTYDQRVDEYNTKINDYNSVIEALNGKPLEAISTPQQQ